MKAPISIPELKYFLKNSVSAKTSVNPKMWTKENPFYGHCAVIALIAQDAFGEIIARGEIDEEWKERLGYSSHYWNILADGAIIDFSKEQFPEDFPYEKLVEQAYKKPKDCRERLLSSPATRNRYETLRKTLEKFINSKKENK